MRRFLLTAVTVCLTSLVNAQPISEQTCINTPFNCNANLVNEQFSDAQIVTMHGIPYAKTTAKIPDVSYYNKNNGNLSDCGISNNCSFDGAVLTYDVYYPGKNFYTCYKTQPLPAIFLFEGGGFSDCVDTAESPSDYCTEFAKRGFVAFSVNYRTGRTKDPSGALAASQLLAMYRAFQDGRGAIRT